MFKKEEKMLNRYLTKEQTAILIENDILHLVYSAMSASRNEKVLVEQIAIINKFDRDMRIKFFDDFLAWHYSKNYISVRKDDFLEFLKEYKG